MRKQIIAGNWKMNGTIASGSILIEAFTSFLGDKNLDCEVVVCPPFTALERAVSLTRDTQVGVGAQNMDYHDAGAFTGEVSPLMLMELGVSYVIIGHSERREYLLSVLVKALLRERQMKRFLSFTDNYNVHYKIFQRIKWNN